MQTAHIAQTNAQPTDYPQWVIVENAGTDAEDVWSDHAAFDEAMREMRSCGGADFGFDLMKRLPDGTLTTEF
jgi:hypothetical protein